MDDLIKDILDETPEEKEKWRNRAQEDSKQRGGSVSNLYRLSKEVPKNDPNSNTPLQKVALRPLSYKYVECRAHWFYLPNGQIIRVNCACPKEKWPNHLVLCDACKHINEHPEALGDNKLISSTFHSMMLVGQFETILIKEGENTTRETVILWDPDPKIVEMGPGPHNGFRGKKLSDGSWFAYDGNPDWPSTGAENAGDITAHNLAVWKIKTGPLDINVEYKIEYFNTTPRPVTGTDKDGNEVPIDYNILPAAWERIQKDSAPWDNTLIRERIAASMDDNDDSKAPVAANDSAETKLADDLEMPDEKIADKEF